jgi:hypothetical protein
MIKITVDPVLRPPGTAPELVFDDHVERIVIGRLPSAQVSLKADLTKLGRSHFELRRAAGGVELLVDREHPVFVEGRRVVERMMLPLRQEVRLLDPVSGPIITIICEKTGDVPVTEKDALEDSGTQQGALYQLVRRGKALALAASLAAIAFGGYIYWDMQQEAARNAALLQGMQNLAERMTEAEEQSVNWAEVQANVRKSVYQVTFQEASGGPPLHQGTAWVYDGKRLATNAHVAALFTDPTLQGRLLLVPADPLLPTVPVINVTIHPAYAAYRATVKATRKVGEMPPLASIGSYDVAFLEVPDGSMLGPALKLAEDETAAAPGVAVAYLGYSEKCARHVDQLHVKSGIISGVSDFLGTENGHELIYHTAPGAGGASGSPLFNGKGEVVGVFSGGEPSKPVEAVSKDVAAKDERSCSISGAATLYAQNVSLLKELDSGKAGELQAAREAQWRNSALYKLNMASVWAAVAALAEDPAAAGYFAQRVRTKLARSVTSKSTRGVALQTFTGLAPGDYAVFADVALEDGVTLLAHVNGVTLNVPLEVDGKPTAVFSLADTNDVNFTIAGPDARDVDVIAVRIDGE